MGANMAVKMGANMAAKMGANMAEWLREDTS